MADFTFYTNPMSRGWIAWWALHEVGADYEPVIVDWAAKSEAFLAANPMGKVPALVHHHGGHDHVVTECAAICHYLAETHPDSGLQPSEHEKADYFRWLFFAAGPVEQAVLSRAMGWEVPEGRNVMAGFGSFDLTMDTLKGWLSTHDFVCGDRFTMADVYVGSHVDWGLQFGSIPTRPAFEAYAKRLRERDGYKEAKAIDTKLIEESQNG
ncbi:glutathione S-transferase family protein [Altererythrobacter sp.]|uniref:glutathione S-transferase family protein n=2 Tax=Altererythrobacter sp. TaxID=1872480 RepID=UPI003D08AAFE